MRGSVARFLLEKSRVVLLEGGERNYHAFYQLAAGAAADAREKLQLPASAHDAAAKFRYLRGGSVGVRGVDDAADFAATAAAG